MGSIVEDLMCWSLDTKGPLGPASDERASTTFIFGVPIISIELRLYPHDHCRRP